VSVREAIGKGPQGPFFFGLTAATPAKPRYRTRIAAGITKLPELLKKGVKLPTSMVGDISGSVMLRSRAAHSVGFVKPCLPSPAHRPPTGDGWLHEIKHDGMRIMARRDAAGVRLITRHGNDFTARFPLAVEAVSALPARSFLLDGEAIVTNERGLAVFDLIRHKRHGDDAVLIAFDLIELDGD
jgi:ATP-dependent DNA ligase